MVLRNDLLGGRKTKSELDERYSNDVLKNHVITRQSFNNQLIQIKNILVHWLEISQGVQCIQIHKRLRDT